MSVAISGGELRSLEKRSYQPGSAGSYLRFVPDLTNVVNGKVSEPWRQMLWDPEALYRSQSAVRMVTNKIARRGAVVPLDAFVRVSATERQPLEGEAAGALKKPMPRMGQSRWMYDLLLDMLLWDRWLCIIAYADGPDGRQLSLARLAPWAWRYGSRDGTDWSTDVVTVLGEFELGRDQVVTDCGRGLGTSPTDTIRTLIEDLYESEAFRLQTWQNGGRVTAVIERPSTAPDWAPEEVQRFLGDWRSMWAGRGPQAGGTAILEDDMKLAQLNGWSAEQLQWVEGRQASIVEACMAWSLAPEIMGVRQGNYSNEREKRKALWQDTLNPVLTPMGEAFTEQFIIPWSGEADAYGAFNPKVLLQGSFDEEADALQKAVGGPYMLAAEARAMYDLELLPDGQGSKLIVPMNVTEGGLASPADTAPTTTRAGVPPAVSAAKGLKAAAPARRPRGVAPLESRLADDLAGVYRRMRRDVMRQVGDQTKAILGPVEWDDERWKQELSAAMLKSTPAIASVAAEHVLQRYAPGYDWSDDPMQAWLDSQAAVKAEQVNDATRNRVIEILGLGEAAREGLAAVFDTAEGATAPSLASSLSTDAMGLGMHDAATASGLGEKSWRVTSAKPRDSHAALDGETVPLAETFSLGGRWPGDPSMGVDEVAGCTCVLAFD